MLRELERLRGEETRVMADMERGGVDAAMAAAAAWSAHGGARLHELLDLLGRSPPRPPGAPEPPTPEELERMPLRDVLRLIADAVDAAA